MSIPVAQQRMLLQRSGNVCAFPDCRLLLTAEGTPDDPVVVLGEMAHIVGESPKGPRGESDMTPEQRNMASNLILLCNQHHQLIDSKGAEATYTVQRLLAMKEAHEHWVERSLQGRHNAAPELPPIVHDTVYSNLLHVRQMPQYIYGAPCLVANERDVHPKTGPGNPMAPFIVRGGWLWGFQDLRDADGPFAEFVTAAETEQHLTVEFWTEPDRLGWYIALLNRCLNKLTGRLGLRYDRAHQRYYFAPEAAGMPKEVSYRPLNRQKATRSVVWQPTKQATGEARKYWLHRAVNLRFIQAGGQAGWFLSIRPELRVTSDGLESLDGKQIGRRVTRKKSRLFNYDLLGEVQFWRDFLSSSTPQIVMAFGPGRQRILISSSMSSTDVTWPGIPEEHAMPFKNVEYVDDLFTWAEAEGLLDGDEESDEPEPWDDDDLEEENTP